MKRDSRSILASILLIMSLSATVYADNSSCIMVLCEDMVNTAHRVLFKDGNLILLDESGEEKATIENQSCTLTPHDYCY